MKYLFYRQYYIDDNEQPLYIKRVIAKLVQITVLFIHGLLLIDIIFGYNAVLS